MLKPALAGAILALLASAAYADAPQPTHVAPGTGGTAPNRGPGPTVLGLQPNEVRAGKVKGLKVMSSDGLELGLIGNFLLDRKRHAIDLAGLQTTRAPGKSIVVIPWSGLAPARRPAGGYVSPLSPQAVENARSFEEAVRAHPDYLDVEHDVLGRQVVGRDGQHRGMIVDLVFELQSGAVDYVLLDTGAGMGVGNEAQAVPWSAIAALPKERDKSVTLKLDAQQLAEAPFFGLKARQRPQDINPQKVFRTTPRTGNIPRDESPLPGQQKG
jgi:sporulation protein YlmC with PRC-barrel domain